MTKISEQSFDAAALFDELAADPSTPASGTWRLYPKSGGIYAIDDAGTVVGPFSAGGGGNTLSVTRVHRSSAQNVSGSGAFTSISFNVEDVDDDGAWAIGTPTQIVIPAALNTRKVQLLGQIIWSSATSGTYRHILVLRNGTDSVGEDQVARAGGYNTAHHVQTPVLTVATGDTFELQMRCDATGIGSAGTAEFQTWFELRTVD